MIGYRREKFVRETRIECATAGCSFTEQGVLFKAHIEPHGEWDVALNIVTVDAKREACQPQVRQRGCRSPARYGGGTLKEWIAKAPQIETSWRSLERTYKRSLVDLAALRFYPGLAPNEAIPAAGLPWFMAMFGRDSIITSLQALPFYPELARTTLRVLGMRQGTRVDHFRDEEPGKILHESRWGELTAFEERPHSPYFGTADATPLFLVLLDEYERWSGDKALVPSSRTQARAALHWIDDYGDRDGDGYVEYDRRNKETGLENQCWKDSWDSIAFADGRLGERPLATCEIQGYVYDAKMRCARLAREIWKDEALAQKLLKEAVGPQGRFNVDYWIPSRRCFALALDKDKRQVDSLTSNIGHLLFSGIVDDDKADDVVGHLMGEELFSGWGIRTMATAEARYNPIGYHVGTIWPHDNSIIALGLIAMAGAPRLPPSAWASWRRPNISTTACPRPSRAIRARIPSSRWNTPPPARRKPGRPGAPCCCCGCCSGWSRSATIWSWSRPSRPPSPISASWVPKGPGAVRMRSDAACSISAR